MRYGVFSVRDNVAEAFLPPLFMRSKGEAIRSFADAANSGDHQFHKHAGDYVLYHLGTWDDGTATFEAEPFAPVKVVSGLDVLQRE